MPEKKTKTSKAVKKKKGPEKKATKTSKVSTGKTAKAVKPKSTNKKKTSTKLSDSKKDSVAPSITDMTPQKPGFPVVGIGASAGGLEAMTALIKHLPNDIGMAFVLVQHLAPTHESMMAELLARETLVKVTEAADGEIVMPNHIYVIPPNKNLGIINGVLHLMPRNTDKQHLPIDYFFKSLAADQASNAIGIILSGSATDGTLGLKAIKAEGGITFAQSKETASYESMPASVIAAGCVDFVQSPAEIGQELVHIARHPDLLRAEIVTGRADQPDVKNELDKVFLLLRSRTGHDFTYYKHTTIRRRISRRMLVNKIDRLKDYVRYLNAHPAEVDALFQDILINVTSFFRDPETFDVLKETVFPNILKDRTSGLPIRIWVPGCSTGEEVYSILIALLEYLGDDIANVTIQVFASDIDENALAKARAGIYPEQISAEISQERLRRFFTKVSQGYQISKRIRDLCVFAPQSIIKDPPFSHQDLIACRNMLIYMGNVLQRKILQTLHYALSPGGYLFLGNSETVGSSADLFALADKTHKIYKRKDVRGHPKYRPGTVVDLTPIPNIAKAPVPEMQHTMDLQRLAESTILNNYSPAGVVVNEQLDVMQFIGHTGPYLDPTPGAASLNLIKLAHPELTVELRVTAHNAIRSKAAERKEGVRVRHNGNIVEITIEVAPLQAVDNEYYYLVLFQKTAEYDANKPPIRGGKTERKKATETEDDHINKLEQELDSTKSYMQSIIEDQEAANEELQSANEEIQSTNEELQSTNEELETAKEELQSTNEELITVNEELENRNDELSTVNDDLNNIVASMELPLVILNEAMHVRFFSPQAHTLLNLIDSDIGRSIGDIRPNVDIGNITEYVHTVIETLAPLNMEVHDDQGHWYSMRIRPYRTGDNRIKGANILFIDITDSKTLQRAGRLATVVEDSNDAITVQDFDGRILAWNPRAIEVYGYTEKEVLNANIDIIVPENERQVMQEMVSKIKQGKFIRPFEAYRLNKAGETIRMLVTMSLLRNEKGIAEAVATTERLISD